MSIPRHAAGKSCETCKHLEQWNENHGDGGPGEPMAECIGPGYQSPHDNGDRSHDDDTNENDDCVNWEKVEPEDE